MERVSVILFLLSSYTCITVSAGPLDAFLAPQAGYAGGADLIAPLNVSSIEECANLCLNFTGATYNNLGCIHFNACELDQQYRCGIGGWNRTLTFVSTGGCAYYQRILPRNDSAVTPAIPYLLDPPTGGVQLNGGLLQAMSDVSIQYLLTNYGSVDNLLYQFRKRGAGLPNCPPNPPGAKCFGWDCGDDWVEGSAAGLFLMGAGGHLRWQENPTLRALLDQLVQGIANCSQPNGYIMAFPEDTLDSDEHPDYTLSWTTHGLLEAHAAGNTAALPLLRGMLNLFNNHTRLPRFLPPDGGNAPYQTPVNPPPPKWNGVNCSGLGAKSGHSIYLISQGLIHNTRMALSPAGTQADVDLIRNVYQEDWWLDFLATGDPAAIWKKQWFSHNYEITAYEAYLDMYVLTGEERYLQAVQGAWTAFRTYFQHLGGSVAINEIQYYYPGSYYLTEAGPLKEGAQPIGTRKEVHEARERYHSHSHSHGHGHGHVEDPDGDACGISGWGHHPTGEFCGAVFWLKLNQRFHRLYPDSEVYVAEIEKEMFNEGPAHQGANGTGIRYYSNLNGVKMNPDAVATCCEGQGTRLYGSLPEYLYSTQAGTGTGRQGVYVDIYAPSTFLLPAQDAGLGSFNITTVTAWPFGQSVTILLSTTSQGQAAALDVALRMPAWLAVDSLPVSVSTAAGAVNMSGSPGSYLKLPALSLPATLTFTLPMAVTAHVYSGETQIPPYVRYGYTYGPILLAAVGGWNSTLATVALGDSGLDPSSPTTWLSPSADGNPLHFAVAGRPDVTFMPLGEVGAGVQYSVYPVFTDTGAQEQR